VCSFQELIGKLVKIGVINTAGALGFYQSTLELLDRSAGNADKLEALAQIWSTVAACLQELINVVC
jgi:hypothetical protein